MSSVALGVRRTPSSLRTIIGLWPIVAFFMFAMILNPLLFVMLEQSNTPYTQFVFLGILFGELVLVGTIGGLFGRHWVVGYLVGLVLAIIGLCVIWQVTDHRISAFRRLPWFWRACHIPATLLVASLPLMSLRLFRHWRISRTIGQKRPWGIEDLLIATSIVGCVIALLVTPTIVANAFSTLASRLELVLDSSRLITDELVFGAWGALALGLTAPLAYMTLDRNKTLLSRMKQIVVHLLLSTVIGVAIMGILSRSVAQLPQFAVGFATSYCITAVGLVCLRASGFQLHGRRSRLIHHATSSSKLADADESVSANDSLSIDKKGSGLQWAVWLPRTVTLAMLGVVVYVSIVAGGFQRLAREAVQTFSQAKESLMAKGGSIDGSTHRTASFCVFSSEMGDAELEQIASCAFIERLDLSGSKITDEGIKLLPRLQSIRDLDLSDTAITDESLDVLAESISRLRSLNLAKTKVTVSGVTRLSKMVRTGLLDLSDNGITDEELASLEVHPRTVVLVHGNPITAASLTKLCAFRGVGLGRNELGDNWSESLSKVPEVLILDGADIDDNFCKVIAGKTPFIDRLHLRNTSITDLGVQAMSGLATNTLEISGSQVTDNGLAKAKLKVAYQLKLGGSLSGACLNEWSLPTIEALDLSDSQVDDSVLSTIRLPDSLRRFSLCNTKISDVGLPQNVGKSLEVLAIAKSNVSANAVLKLNVRTLLVESDRLSSDQLGQLRNRGIDIVVVGQDVSILDESRQENRN